MSTAPSLLRSLMQVLTRPDLAWLLRSDEIGLVQGGVAVEHGPRLHWGKNPGPSACKADVLTATLWNHVHDPYFKNKLHRQN